MEKVRTLYSCCAYNFKFTLVRLTMTGYIVADKNNGGINLAE